MYFESEADEGSDRGGVTTTWGLTHLTVAVVVIVISGGPGCGRLNHRCMGWQWIGGHRLGT